MITAWSALRPIQVVTFDDPFQATYERDLVRRGASQLAEHPPPAGSPSGEWAPTWLATKASRKAKTQLSYGSLSRTRVLPDWGRCG